MSDLISVSCLILLLWLVVRDLSREKSRPEPPLLPQHQNNARYTVPLLTVEQQSVSEHQHQEEALPTKARYVHLEHEQVASAKPLQTVQVSVSSVSQERNEADSQALPEQINEPGQSHIQTVQLSVPSVSQERNEAPLQALPQQIIEPEQSPILVPVFVSPTNSGGQATLDVSQRGPVHIHQFAGTFLVPDVNGASQLTQDDLNDGSGDYVRLRERAREEVEVILKYRKEKKRAEANGQLKLVQELTEEVKIHQQRHQLFNEQACALTFAKNNKNRSPDMIDLHGLTAEEAATHAMRAISDAREKGITEIRLIVGKGLHSSGPPVLKPAMLALMRRLKLSAEVDPVNEGVLVVQLLPTSIVSSPVMAQGWDQTLVQPLSPQTSQLGQSLVLFPEIQFTVETDQWISDASQSPVENCQSAPAPDVDEVVPHLPQDNNNTENEGNNLVMIRERAKEERKMKLHYRKGKKLAKALGQTALANEMAQKMVEHANRLQLLDAQMSELIFVENNKGESLDTVVLLNLKPKEAKNFAERVVQVACEQGMTELRMVVGEGPYSDDGPYPIKPVVSKFLKKKCGIPVQVDPTNNGVLVITLPRQLEPSSVLLPEIDLSSTEPDQPPDDISQGPVEICQATLTLNAGEEVSKLPQVIRERAKEERNMMLSYRKEKKLALARGQMVLFRQLEEKESEHENRSELLNAQASELIFAKNNKSRPLGTVVLLDLKPKEAKNFAKHSIQVARRQDLTELRMVVGEGPYSISVDGPYPIKPVLLKFLKKKHGIPARVDPTNNGVLVVVIGPECDNI